MTQEISQKNLNDMLTLNERFFHLNTNNEEIMSEIFKNTNNVFYFIYIITQKCYKHKIDINELNDFNEVVALSPMEVQKINELSNNKSIKSDKFSTSKKVTLQEEFEESFREDFAEELIEIKQNNLEKAKEYVTQLIKEESEKHIRNKYNCMEIDYAAGKKVRLFNIEDCFDIFKNEEIEKETGQTIKDNTFMKRAEILRKHIHITKEYPLAQLNKETIQELENLKIYYPNFSKVLDEVIGYAVLSLMNKDSYFYMKPILLAGDPGVGKTSFTQKLAKILGLHFSKMSLITCTASWTITGMDLSWSGGKPGKIFEFLSEAKMANPLVMLDELDKGSKENSSGGNPIDTLHELLEKETSQGFQDEAMLMEMNASYINWIATANILENIPESILSRFKIFHIKNIDEESRSFVIRNVFKNIVENSPNKNNIDVEITAEQIALLEHMNIRSISTVLESALAHAAKTMWLNNTDMDNKIVLSIDDIKAAIEQN